MHLPSTSWKRQHMRQFAQFWNLECTVLAILEKNRSEEHSVVGLGQACKNVTIK
jgi:hypothetical protein